MALPVPRTRSSDTLNAVIAHSVPAIVERGQYTPLELELGLMHDVDDKDAHGACRAKECKDAQVCSHGFCAVRAGPHA